MEITVSERNSKQRALTIGLAVVIVLFTCPIGIADLVYSFKDEECLNEYPDYIYLNMKKYLITSGILTLFTCLYMMVNLFYLRDEPPICLMIINIVVVLTIQSFLIIWNVLGAILFWSFIYPDGNCSLDLSSYLFASLIIKLVFTYMNIMATIK
jgi:hypothetical protein